MIPLRVAYGARSVVSGPSRGREGREPGGRVVHDQPLSVRGSVFSVRLLLRERLGKWAWRNNFLWGFVAGDSSPWNFDPVKRFRDALRYRFLLSFHFLYFIPSLFTRRWCTCSPHKLAICVRVLYTCFPYRLRREHVLEIRRESSRGDLNFEM